MFNPAWPPHQLDGKKEHQKYYLKDGTLVPGVTTVLGKLSKPQLIHWAWTLGMEGVDYRTIRDAAADVGTVAHFMAECWINKRNPEFINYDPDLIAKGELSFRKFQRFWAESAFTLVRSEYQLVSEKHRYGGTLDVVAMDEQGDLIILDIKTSKAVYPDYHTQLAAYVNLWNENHENPIDRYYIVRIGKEDPEDFDIQEYSKSLIDLNFKRFQSVLEVHHIDTTIKTLIKNEKNSTSKGEQEEG